VETHYTGIWVGFALVVFEDLLNPETHRKLALPGANIAIGIRWGIAAACGAAFLFSHSLWFVAFLHWLIEMGSAASLRNLMRHRPPTITKRCGDLNRITKKQPFRAALLYSLWRDLTLTEQKTRLSAGG